MKIWLYIAPNGTPNIDCYWGRGSTQCLGLRVYGLDFRASIALSLGQSIGFRVYGV